MRPRWTRTVAIPLLAGVAACGDTAGPGPQNLAGVELDFCSNESPAFFAYQNEGGPWTRVLPDAFGTFTFDATEKVGLAIIHQAGSAYSSEYIFAARADIEPASSQTCDELSGVKNLSGSIANVPAGSATMISMGGQFAYVTAPTTSFTLNELPAGPLDLIAHREVVGPGPIVPDRVIVRRAQDRLTGTAIPPLDFGNSESRAVSPHTFTATGISANDDTYYLLGFSTQTTKDHSLSPLVSFASGAQTLYGIPAELIQSGDFHTLDVFADAGTGYRGETQYYRNTSNRTVALGPGLNVPTVAIAATTPHLRLRTQLASQPEYASLMSVFYQQGSNRTVVVTITSGYAGGTPTTWDVTVPDLSAVSGFPTASSLQSGTQTTWFVDAYGGGPASTFFTPPYLNGGAIRYAGRTSIAQTSVQSRTRGSQTPPRIHSIGRGRGAF